MKINILHIIIGLNVGGAEMMLNKLVTHSNKEKYNNIVVSLTQNNKMTKEFESEGIDVIHLNLSKNPRSLFRCIKSLRGIYKKFNPDIIHSWMYHANIISFLSFIDFKPNTIWNIRHTIHNIKHEKVLTRLIIYINSLFSKYIDLIIFNSQKSLETHTNLGFDGIRQMVIGNGFDTEKFYPNPELAEEIKKELNISKGNYVIGMVARYHPIKGHNIFIEAAKMLVKTFGNVDFVLVGKDVDYDNVKLFEAIKDYGLEDKFHLLGSRGDINNLLATFDIATLTSHSESFPNVIGEAMASGTICLSTDVGGIEKIINNYGLIVPTNDPTKVCEGWIKILSMEDSKKKIMKYNSREHIIKNYSIDSISIIYEKEYKNIIYED